MRATFGRMARSSRSAPSKFMLIGAAAEVIRRRGLEGVRIREVASLAGMSPGSVVYHYPQSEDLIFDVHSESVERYLRERSAAANGTADPRARLLAAAKVGLPDGGPHDDVLHVLYQMHAVSQRSTRHRALLTRLWTEECALYEHILWAGIEAGLFSPAEPVASASAALLVMEDGLALHMTSDQAFTFEQAMTMFTAQAALILDCPSLSDFAAGATS